MTAAERTPKEILARLVSFDTTSHKTNIPMAEWVSAYLAGHGVASTMLPSDDGIHTNMFATIGPAEGAGGIGLSGHMDVVPTTSQPWDSDPYTVVERDGRLYGRGTCDMKGFIACVLAMVPELKAREAQLKTPIHIVLSYDEEVGCTGVKPMVEAFGKTIPKPRIIIVGEPTNMTVVDAHKGGYRFRTDITGKDAHSSKPQLWPLSGNSHASGSARTAEACATSAKRNARARTTIPIFIMRCSHDLAVSRQRREAIRTRVASITAIIMLARLCVDTVGGACSQLRRLVVSSL